MQKLAVAIAAVATLTGASAFAADMAVKAPPLPPLAVPNWTGFYIGGALGGKWANTTWTTTSTSDLPGTIKRHAARQGNRRGLRLLSASLGVRSECHQAKPSGPPASCDQRRISRSSRCCPTSGHVVRAQQKPHPSWRGTQCREHVRRHARLDPNGGRSATF